MSKFLSKLSKKGLSIHFHNRAQKAAFAATIVAGSIVTTAAVVATAPGMGLLALINVLPAGAIYTFFAAKKVRDRICPAECTHKAGTDAILKSLNAHK